MSLSTQKRKHVQRFYPDFEYSYYAPAQKEKLDFKEEDYEPVVEEVSKEIQVSEWTNR